jgi:hypothetical protein
MNDAKDLLEHYLSKVSVKEKLEEIMFQQEYLSAFVRTKDDVVWTIEDLVKMFQKENVPAKFIRFKTFVGSVFVHTNIYKMREEFIEYLKNYTPISTRLYFKQQWDLDSWDDDYINKDHYYPYMDQYLGLDELKVTNTERFLMED